MAATLSVASPQQQAVNTENHRGRLVQIAFAATDYPTGGYAITPANIGLNEIYGAIPVGINNAVITTGVYWQWNTTTGKVQAFGSNGAAPAFLAEIANAADVSAQKVRFWFIGA
jgi:hypothetical protein